MPDPRLNNLARVWSNLGMISPKFRSLARRWWQAELRPIIVIALVVFCIRSSLADWNDVPSGSMNPTILEGDRVYVNKLAYDLKFPFTTWHMLEWSNPQRGDIVVFYSPHDGKRLVKRVVGLPGDTIELRNDNLILNGRPIQYRSFESDVLDDLPAKQRSTQVFATEQLPGREHAVAAWPGVTARRDFGPIIVPQGQYFMMGDNRDNSFDSRYYGAVDRKQILGRATMAVLSFDREHHWSPRWHRFFTTL
jgi:signal peptidase I